MADEIDLTLIRYRNLDRKVSDLLDKLETLADFVSSLDGHITQLHNDAVGMKLTLPRFEMKYQRLTAD